MNYLAVLGGREFDSNFLENVKIPPYADCHPLGEPLLFIIEFSYNARSDWLKQSTLSENRERVTGNDIKLAFKFLLRNFDKFDPN